jgi:Domain of unknown function (DUF5666)
MSQNNSAKTVFTRLITAFMLLFAALSYAAGNDVCSTASLVNPNMDGGMGGTGIGMGGTGATANGGTGGTGVVAVGGFGGTGDAVVARLLPQDTAGGIAIVGVVTGFASICVNGEEVFYDKNTPVYDNGMAAKLSSLDTGKMVILKADKVGGQLRARAIGLFDTVAGPVDQLDANRMQMRVMGQTVKLNKMTMQQMQGLEAGAAVSISGHRLANGEIVATKVSANSKTNVASTIGIVTSIAKDGFVVNGTKVSVDKALLDNMKVGSEVRVGGDWNGSAIKANRIEGQPIKNMLNHADSAILEGFVRIDGKNSVALSGTEVELNQVSRSYKQIANANGKVVKMEMHRDSNGNWVCDKVEIRKGSFFNHHGDGNREKNEGSSDGSDSLEDSSSDSSGKSGSGDNDSQGSSDSSGSSGSISSGSSSSGSSSSGSSSDSGHDSSGGGSSSSGASSGSTGRSSGGSSHGSGGTSAGGRSSGSGKSSGGGSSGGGKNK